MARNSNIRDLIKKNRAYIADLKKQTYKEIMLIVLAMDASTKDKLTSGGRTGRTYKRRTVTHVASAPGEFPASDRGDMVNNLYIKGDKVHYEVRYGNTMLHAKHLEYKPASLGGRPWLKPQADIFAPKLFRALRNMNRKLILKHFR